MTREQELESALKQSQAREVGYRHMLERLLNYLNFSTDDLCGDDLVGDKRKTRRFNEYVLRIEKTLSAHPAPEILAVIEAAESFLCSYNDGLRMTDDRITLEKALAALPWKAK